MPLKRDDDPQGCNDIDVTALFPVSKAFFALHQRICGSLCRDRMDRSLYLNPLDSYAGSSKRRVEWAKTDPASNQSWSGTMFSRRYVLAASALGAAMTTSASAQTFGNPDQPPQGAINSRVPVTDPGPQNPAIANQFPSAQSPPATDVGGMPLTWASFNNAPKRIQNLSLIHI